jgi:hypothetical protein
MKKLEYLIVGTGRSGTVFYAKLLTSLGIPCGHESFFNYQDIDGAILRLSGKAPPTLSDCSQFKHDGTPTPFIRYLHDLVAESSYMAVPYLHHECLNDTKIIHVVRHPVRVVNSFVNYLGYFHSPSLCLPPNPIYESFIYRHLPELRNYPAPLERAAMYYVLWNELIEKRETLARFKVEDGPGPLQNLLGIESKTVFDDRTANTQEKVGARFDIRMLPQGEVRERFAAIGEKYGYNMASDILLM